MSEAYNSERVSAVVFRVQGHGRRAYAGEEVFLGGEYSVEEGSEREECDGCAVWEGHY